MGALNHQYLDKHQLMMREIFKNNCLRKMPQNVIKREGLNKINQTFNISGLPDGIVIHKIIHPDGKTEIKIENNTFVLKDFYQELPIIYIRCNKDKTKTKYYGAIELNLSGETDVTLHNFSTNVQGELKCNWPHDLVDVSNIIKFKIETSSQIT